MPAPPEGSEPAIDSTFAIMRSTLRFWRLRHAEAPPRLGGEALEEVEIIGAFRRLPHQFIEAVGILADQDAPSVGLDPIEDDGCSLRRGRWRVLDEAPCTLGRQRLNVGVRHGGYVHAGCRGARSNLRAFPRRQRGAIAAAMDVA